jgi:hypothetical protein
MSGIVKFESRKEFIAKPQYDEKTSRIIRQFA